MTAWSCTRTIRAIRLAWPAWSLARIRSGLPVRAGIALRITR